MIKSTPLRNVGTPWWRALTATPRVQEKAHNALAIYNKHCEEQQVQQHARHDVGEELAMKTQDRRDRLRWRLAGRLRTGPLEAEAGRLRTESTGC